MTTADDALRRLVFFAIQTVIPPDAALRAVEARTGLVEPVSFLAATEPGALLVLAPTADVATAIADAAIRLVAADQADTITVRRARPSLIHRVATATTAENAATFFGTVIGLDAEPVVARENGTVYRVLRPAGPAERRTYEHAGTRIVRIDSGRVIIRPADFPQGSIVYTTLGEEPWI